MSFLVIAMISSLPKRTSETLRAVVIALCSSGLQGIKWAVVTGPDDLVDLALVRAKRYFNCALLIIDEVGFRPRDWIEANLFFRLVSARYERGSIVLTSNKHVHDWPEIFAGDEILTTAILDRLLHHVVPVHIDGRSYRLRELGALLGPKLDSPPAPSPQPGGHP